MQRTNSATLFEVQQFSAPILQRHMKLRVGSCHGPADDADGLLGGVVDFTQVGQNHMFQTVVKQFF